MKSGRIIQVQDYMSHEHNLYYLVITLETSHKKTNDIKIDYSNQEDLARGLFYWNSLFEKSESLHETGGSEMYTPDELANI